MDERTYALLTALSERLGTTAEHLWGVMVQQALISGVVGLVEVGATIAVCWWVIRLVARKTTAPAASAMNPYPCAEWESDMAGLAIVVSTVFVGGAVVVVSVALFDISSALLNPEYWALSRLLRALR